MMSSMRQPESSSSLGPFLVLGAGVVFTGFMVYTLVQDLRFVFAGIPGLPGTPNPVSPNGSAGLIGQNITLAVQSLGIDILDGQRFGAGSRNMHRDLLAELLQLASISG